MLVKLYRMCFMGVEESNQKWEEMNKYWFQFACSGC